MSGSPCKSSCARSASFLMSCSRSNANTRTFDRRSFSPTKRNDRLHRNNGSLRLATGEEVGRHSSGQPVRVPCGHVKLVQGPRATQQRCRYLGGRQQSPEQFGDRAAPGLLPEVFVQAFDGFRRSLRSGEAGPVEVRTRTGVSCQRKGSFCLSRPAVRPPRRVRGLPQTAADANPPRSSWRVHSTSTMSSSSPRRPYASVTSTRTV